MYCSRSLFTRSLSSRVLSTSSQKVTRVMAHQHKARVQENFPGGLRNGVQSQESSLPPAGRHQGRGFNRKALLPLRGRGSRGFNRKNPPPPRRGGVRGGG